MNAFFQELAERHGTPAYCYDLGLATRRAAELQALFPAQAEPRLLYSFKANPLPSLAGELRRAGCEADLTSPGELRASARAGFDLGRALYGGPGKTANEIGGAIDAGVRQFSVESWHDLAAIATAARQAATRVRALLRVNPLQAPRAKLAMAGVASQFGFEEENLTEIERHRIEAVADAVEVVGIHVYWGTQIEDAEALAACFRSAVDTAENVARKLGFELRFLNLGGGFPWPYAKAGERDLSALRPLLAAIYAEAGSARDARWWFESGRYLAASSGTLLTRVVELKVSKGRTYVVLDTGIHHLGGMAGLGRIPRFAIDLITVTPRSGELTADVVGQLCTPLDCLARNLTLPAIEPGDLLAIPNVGAYGATGSLTGFLSRPTPLEIAFQDSEVTAIHQLPTGHQEVTLF
tara:strand:- start:8348 stop:9574 length:1227 start_codon:yes stop_codon:yes gene_type:complete